MREGDTVAAGAPLVAIDADLQSADGHTAAAQAAEARAKLARLETAQQRKEEIAVLEAQERRAEAMLALATTELERQQTLSAKGVAAQAQLDIAKANFSRDKAALEEVRRQIELGHLPSRDEDIAAARQSLAAAQARQNSVETKLARRKLVSPVSGTVQQVYYRPGEMVAAGRPVLSILPPGNIKVRFFVRRGGSASSSRSATTVKVACDGCAQPLEARISFIARAPEYTPPVIYSLEERNEARLHGRGAPPTTPDGLARRASRWRFADPAGSPRPENDLARHRHRGRRRSPSRFGRARGRARPLDAGAARVDLRLPRAERLGQDHHHPHALRPAHAGQAGAAPASATTS